MVADFVRLGEVVSVTIIKTGTGCDDGNCVWIQGSGFTRNMEVVVRDSAWNPLNTYTGSELDVNLSTYPQGITLRLMSDPETQDLRSGGLIVTVASGDTGTWDSRSVSP